MPVGRHRARDGGARDGAIGLSAAAAGDLVALMKPRVMALAVFTAFVGMLVAPGAMNPFVAVGAIAAIALGAGAAGVLNMWYDMDIDAVMSRTANRPLPRGRVPPADALDFGLMLATVSVMLLEMLTGWLAASLLAFTIFFYVVVYTMWLKRSTPQNIVIGGAAGAAPPVLGWAAVTGHVHPYALLLFLIIFVWTPPHFWALAIFRRDDYSRAQVPMLPVTHGVTYTRWHVLFYTILLLVITVLPYLTGMSGLFYLGGALVLGAGFLYYAIRLLNPPDEFFAMRVFNYSIVYLMALFAFLLIDHYLSPPAFQPGGLTFDKVG